MINKKKQYIKNSMKNNSLSLKFKPYAQYYEDLILYGLFYDISNGFYISIGVNSPDNVFTTKIFYEYNLLM